MNKRLIILLAALIASVALFLINHNRMMESKKTESRAIKLSHIHDRIGDLEMRLSYEKDRQRMLEDTYSKYREQDDADELKECREAIRDMEKELRHYQDKIYGLD